jgi:predicted dehydrogenase
VIASEPDLRLAAAWDADPSAVPGVISSHAVRDADTAVSRADAVVVCAPTDQRPGLCVRAARAGRPVLVALPLARSAAEARSAAREMERSRTPALPMFHLRELPALGRLRGILRSGLLGRVSGVTATYVNADALDRRLHGPTGWMLDPRRAGVGALGELAIHLLDALAGLGSVPMLDAVALDRGPAGSTDLGGVGVGRWADAPLSLRASRVTRPPGLELTIAGAAASAEVRGGILELVAEDGSRERWVGPPPDPGESVRSFTARLRTRQLGRDGLAGAISAQETIERAAGVG